MKRLTKQFKLAFDAVFGQAYALNELQIQFQFEHLLNIEQTAISSIGHQDDFSKSRPALCMW